MNAPRVLLWVLMLACLMTGCLQEMFPTSTAIYWLNLLTLSSVATYTVARCMITPVNTTLWDFFAAMVGMMYGLGTLNTEIKAISSLRDLALLTDAPVLYVHLTMGMVSILVAVLLAMGLFTKERLLEGVRPESMNHGMVLLFSSVTALLCIALVLTGAIGYHGDLLANESVTPNASATYAIFCFVPAACALVYTWRRHTGWGKLVAGATLLVFFALALYLGRRNVVYLLVTCSVAYFAALGNTRIFSRRIFLVAVAAAVLLPAISTGFMAMRMASYEIKTSPDQKVKVGELIKVAIDILKKEKGEVDRQSEENLRDRAYLVGYLSELNWRTDTRQPLYGDLFLYNAAMSIPRAVWPTKFLYVRTGSEEALAHPLLGMPVWDAANSVLTTGMTDFGPLGMLSYPIGILALLLSTLKLLRRLDTHVYFVMFFATLNSLANVEGQMLAYFTFLRDVTLVSVVMYGLILVSRFFTDYNTPLQDCGRTPPLSTIT